MAINKDAAKADIGPKKQVKATFAECTAVEPLKCKYHGLKALDKMIGNILASSGHPMPFVTDKHDNEYELRLPGDIDLPMSTFSKISEALKNQGFSIFNKGQTEEGAFKYKIKPVDGKEFVTPDGEAELEDADTLSADKPKEKKEGESKSEEKKDDVDNLESPYKQADAQAQADKEDTSMDVGFLDDLLAEMYDLGIQKDKNFLASWSTLNQEVDEADEHDGKKIKSLIEKAQKLKKEYIDAHKGKSVKQDLFEELENIDADALVDEAELDADLMENFDELDEVVGDAEKDLEAELIGNSDFDDIVFFDDEGNEKDEGKEKAETPPTLSLQDIKDLVSFKGVKEEHFEQNDDLAGTYNAIITTGKNPNGKPLTENQVTWWNDLLDKTKEANPDELPALKVLKETMKKVNGGGRDDGQPFTDEQKQPGELSEMDKEKYYKQWNNLMDTAINGKNLLGTQYWAETISPILDDYNEGLSKNDEKTIKNALSELQAAVASAPDANAEKPTKESLITEMQSIIDKIHDTGLDLTWDEKKGMSLGDKFGEAINANDIEGAAKALANFKDYIHKLETGDEETTMPAEELTAEDIKDFFKKCGIKKPTLLDDKNLEATKTALETGKWLGKPLTNGNKKWYKALAEKAPDHKVAQAINAMLESGIGGEKAKMQKFSLKAIKDWLGTYSGTWDLKIPKESKDAKDILEKGEWQGLSISKGEVGEGTIGSLVDKYKECADSPIKDALLTALGAKSGDDKFTPKPSSLSSKIKNAIFGTTNNGASPSGESLGGESSKEALLAALNGGGKSMAVEGMLQPLEHDDAKFPQNVSQKALDDAISKGKKLGGHGGLGTRLVEIDGKKYVCKAATGTGASVIRNGYNADMAYRAGGVYAPDAQLYDFGDGKTYKLSEFIPGKRLIDVWQTADEAKRDEIRKELLKGYPLDVLFSNYDVLGTSPEDSITVTIQGADGKPQQTHVAFNNIMIGDDGHAYRVDNDGSFAMTGTGGIKQSGGGGYTTKVEAEKWGNWADRKWIDDFRTLRRNEKNLGIFDRYSTADIFLSAGNINLDAVVGTLPNGLQKALAKPLFEMKQMTWRAVNISLGGYKNNEFISMALDASYEASKRGLRELSSKSVSWNDSGFGEYKSHWGNYSPQPFGENPPEKPQDPTTAFADKLKNEDYTGTKIGSIIFSAAKTINYHGGEKKFDEKGNPIGNPMSNPDYKPNAAKIADWEKIDRDKLAELAKTDANAKILLGLYDTIAYSKENGWKKPIGLVPSGLTIQGKLAEDYLSPTEKKIHDDMAGAIAEYKAKMSVYQKELAEYEKRKDAHKKKEEEKARAAGGSPYHNFHDFAKALMEEGIDTNGIVHRVQTNGIAPIESSMGSQKGSSYAEDAVKWKVREMMALGFTPEQILEMAAQKKLYKGDYYTSCINNQLLPHKDEWDRDMASQAMYLGMNMVKMENEHNDLYDKKSGVVFLNRNIGKIPQGLTAEDKKIYSTSSTTGWVGPHVDSAADCMQFEANWWHEPYKQVYAVPLSRIVCCANNDKATGGGYGYGSEQEYVGNLYNLPCWVYHDDQNLTWKGAIDEANKTSGMKGFLKKLASRLGFFSTLPKK